MRRNPAGRCRLKDSSDAPTPSARTAPARPARRARRGGGGGAQRASRLARGDRGRPADRARGRARRGVGPHGPHRRRVRAHGVLLALGAARGVGAARPGALRLGRAGGGAQELGSPADRDRDAGVGGPHTGRRDVASPRPRVVRRASSGRWSRATGRAARCGRSIPRCRAGRSATGRSGTSRT